MTGYVSDDELIWLYNNCYANLYPSLFEGFGLPVLEGMQFGAPTVISNSTSLPEVTGDAAIKLSPDNTDEWTETLLRLASDQGERDHLSEKAREQAKKFDWKQSAHQLLELYQEAITLPKRKDLL
jgi:alpha-1,3-rhamnosyl/mannosyltransferase